MGVDSIVVHCAGCDSVLKEDPHASVDLRRACPNCGSMSRRVDLALSDTITLRSKLGLKARHEGGGRPFVEQTIGDDLHRKSGVWMKLHRLIDRVKNLYHERVTNPATGEVVHECSEPLSDHQGHGSAKPKAKDQSGVDA